MHNGQGFSVKSMSCDFKFIFYMKFSALNGGHTGVVHVVTRLDNGNLLASASFDKTVKVWDINTLSLKYTFNHTNTPEAIVPLDDDGLQMACSDKAGEIIIYDLTNGDTLFKFKNHSGSVTSLTFNKRLNLLASGSSDKSIKIWDLANAESLKFTLDSSLGGHTGWIRSLVYLVDDDTLLASGADDTTIKIWDVLGGTLKFTLEGHSNSIWSLASMGRNLLASGSNDGFVKIWNLSNGKLRNTLKHANQVRKLIALNDSLLASGSWDNTIKIWYIN